MSSNRSGSPRHQVHGGQTRYRRALPCHGLLQRIDAFTGMVILASNLSKNMDEAFMRRLRVVVEFPPPSEAERRRI
jgi:SpoVK/Ycf46/Vps4 family AAA+-type ATPase